MGKTYHQKPDGRRFESVTQLKLEKAMSELNPGRHYRDVFVKSSKYLVVRYKTSSQNGVVRSQGIRLYCQVLKKK